jgi:carbon storage regulator
MGGFVLVLRRRVGETIVVAGEVEIEVIEISRSRVKLGIRAPGNITVARKETLKVALENRLAADLVGTGSSHVVGELLQLLRASELPEGKTGLPVEGDSAVIPLINDVDSTNAESGRYVTTEQYSGHRVERENPHPA